jgi:hypothetical protein
MYKLLIFLKKTDEEKIITPFKESTLKYLSDLTGKEVKAGKVESNLLLEEKYSYFCEVEFSSKDEWDEKINTKEGRIFNKHLMDFHQNITAIFVDYNFKK